MQGLRLFISNICNDSEYLSYSLEVEGADANVILKENFMKPLPTFSVDLLDELEKQFPERSPSPDWPDRQIWIEVGKREVVRHLILRKEIAPDGK